MVIIETRNRLEFHDCIPDNKITSYVPHRKPSVKHGYYHLRLVLCSAQPQCNFQGPVIHALGMTRSQ